MKLYLSSYRIPDPVAFSRFIGKKLSEIRLALILNAKDYKPKEERVKKLSELLEYFTRLGFQTQGLNLLDYDNPADLLEKFKEFDVLWFNGGNTFCLRWAVAKSGAEKVFKEALESGVIYGGDSAGAILAGPTLKYYDKADDPNVAPEIFYTGLNLIDLAVLPHWGSVELDHILGEVEENLKKDGYKTMRLTDSEYLLIENDEITKECFL